MIRVLHVIYWFRTGGVETQLLRILRSYDRNRFHMDTCVTASEPGYLADFARESGAEILSCPRSPNLLSFSQRMFHLLKSRRYDVVHSHAESWSGAILRGAYLAGVPVRIAHARYMLAEGSEVADSLPKKAARAVVVSWGRHWVQRYATRVLAVSEAAMDARWPRWKRNRDRYGVWTAGVDTHAFHPDGDQSSADPRIPTIICVASFRPVKRQDLLLRIFKIVLADIPTARLLLVGTGICKERCEELARELGISDRVEFCGLRSDVSQLLNESDVFCSCSEAEGLPNALLEAQAAGLPVVASDIAPHREVMASTNHGFLFSPSQLDKAARDIVTLLRDESAAKSAGAAGRAHVCRHFSQDVKMTELQDLYERWVAESRR